MPTHRGARAAHRSSLASPALQPVRSLPAFLALLALLTGCSASMFKSRDIRMSYGDTPILVLESGAVIVSKRQVGSLGQDGKLADSLGRPVAYLSESTIRLRGGKSVPIRKDADGTLRIPEQAQIDAGLTPIKHRLRPDGTMAQTRNAAGIEVQGAITEHNRRVILLVLLLTANSMWSEPASSE